MSTEIASEAGNKTEQKASGDAVPTADRKGHLRIGWSTRAADLQAPVGYNEHSYAVRDISGSRVHRSRRDDAWGGMDFGPGDVLGCAICLNGADGDAKQSPAPFSGQVEDDADAASANNTGTSASSTSFALKNHIRFFKNGVPMGKDGVAFDDVNPGTYHPAISCYAEGVAQMNFGPHFVYPPTDVPSGMHLRPISDLCTTPPSPEDAIERVISGGSGGGKEGKKAGAFFSKRTDDSIVSAFRELVRIEAAARHETYLKHLNFHRREIGTLRKERGLSGLESINIMQQ